MELFEKAKTVRLRSHHDKYLLAEEDQESVCQDRQGSIQRAKWTVEFVDGVDGVVRLRSCYGKYLTATDEQVLLGVTGRKVCQTLPRKLDSKVDWEPIRDGFQSSGSVGGTSAKSEGRVIYYSVVEDDVKIEEGREEPSFHFKGHGLEELTAKLEEETGLEDVIVCVRNRLNGKLYPLRLDLPPNNATMHIVVVPSSSKVARDFAPEANTST
ncbi:hypothetical protein RHGRI_028337 [Rhododendron griersonianum]|uniref:DUF569 domain-containing protein n=1 Tax=Rhododendron griersonianum TaxID=479676 RepID=A0AAV6IK51_9ERIC|nr:hypothetical protein RHGRI_028337 [Rhododendron griersonianum]